MMRASREFIVDSCHLTEHPHPYQLSRSRIAPTPTFSRAVNVDMQDRVSGSWEQITLIGF